ncbi:magnesium transporter [Alphaproteobacteria bacterium]
MMIAYAVKKNKVCHVEISTAAELPKSTVWIDMLDPTQEEENIMESLLRVNVPTREEIGLIEVMSPFYKENDLCYMTITAINQTTDDYLDSSALTFILTSTCLVTVRHANIKPFQNIAVLITKKTELFENPGILLAAIIEMLINNIAVIMEKAGNNLDELLKAVFGNTVRPNTITSTAYYNDIIRKIGETGNLISKNRESLMSINRLIIYYTQIEELQYVNRREHRFRLRQVAREVYSLSEYASFLSQRNGFLLDATLGMLSVEQNMTIKAFTVAAAVFMPPTLIASIYGMNFKYIPELNWAVGYPIALLLIVISAVLPYLFFKKKKWL